MEVTSNALWHRSHSRVPLREMSGRVPQPWMSDLGIPPHIRPGDPMLVISGGDRWRSIQNCSFGTSLEVTSGGGH